MDFPRFDDRGYTDATAIVIARSCGSPLWRWMASLGCNAVLCSYSSLLGGLNLEDLEVQVMMVMV